MPIKQPKKRRTNPERSAEMKGKLLDAAERCLIDLGYAHTSNLEVCRRARVSNGALLHHFRTRENLMACTLERLYDRLKQRVIREVEGLKPGINRLGRLVDILCSVFDSEEFKAVLELWIAAANDTALSARVFPVMREFSDSIGPTAKRLLPDMAIDSLRFGDIVNLWVCMLQGMGLGRATFGPADVEVSARLRSMMMEMIHCAFERSAQPEGEQGAAGR